MPKKQFPRRYYQSPGEFINDFRFLMKNRALIRETIRNEISLEFRERLMMAVTEVNGCRYCSYYHARAALEAGIAQEELNQFLAGDIPHNAPTDELPALFYAQHWAESGAKPDPEALQKITQTYGQQKTDAIHIVLRMIRVGNLLGNSYDYLLYRLSFGKLGLRPHEITQA